MLTLIVYKNKKFVIYILYLSQVLKNKKTTPGLTSRSRKNQVYTINANKITRKETTQLFYLS